MKQFDLFDPPNVRKRDPVTSYEAAIAVAPKISKLQRLILDILDRNGYEGATPWELIKETGVIYNTVWRRLSELKNMGMIVNTERTRPNNRGFNETVVVIAEGEHDNNGTGYDSSEQHP